MLWYYTVYCDPELQPSNSRMTIQFTQLIALVNYRIAAHLSLFM